MKIDRGTRMCYAQWRGIYLDAPSDTTTIIIGKGFSQSLSDSIAFIKYLYPATIDTLMGRLSTKEEYIQEIAVGLSGNNLYSSGSALTDSTGQNITIYYHYENLPNTETHYRTFKGKRI